MEARTVRSLGRLGQSGYLLSLDWSPEFKPGQHVGICLHKEMAPRLYSIASAPGAKELEILFNLVPDGELTPKLVSLEPGSRILTQEVMGSFLPQPGRNLWIAAGTGVAPFVSLTRSLFQADEFLHPPLLLHSARLPDDLFFREVFEQAKAAGRLEYLPFVTGKNAAHSGISSGISSEIKSGITRGRLTAYLQDMDAESLLSMDLVMICGSTSLVLDVRDILLDRGLDFHKIVSEVYF